MDSDRIISDVLSGVIDSAPDKMAAFVWACQAAQALQASKVERTDGDRA